MWNISQTHYRLVLQNKPLPTWKGINIHEESFHSNLGIHVLYVIKCDGLSLPFIITWT